MDQANFLQRMFMASNIVSEAGNDSSQAFSNMQRLIRIIGGAEKIIKHPLVMASMGVEESSIPSNIMHGLFGTRYADRDPSLSSSGLGATREQRKVIAMYSLHLFPRFREGNLTSVIGGAATKGGPFSRSYTYNLRELNASLLVDICEKAVSEDVSAPAVINQLGFGKSAPASLPSSTGSFMTSFV